MAQRDRETLVSAWQGGSGHALIAENLRGKIWYSDPQSGTTDFSDLSNAKRKGFQCLRVDNAEFNAETIRSFVEGR